jgi:predicted NBD/HSP70 family sugar kinase
MDESWVVVGLDNGGTKNNATVIRVDGSGQHFLVKDRLETPSRVKEGPDVAVQAVVDAFLNILKETRVAPDQVDAVGFDTPGPATANGVLSARGSTNFNHPGWRSFDFRGAVEKALEATLRKKIPVVYSNDANAAALYAHNAFFKQDAATRSSISAVVGTGLGGGVIESGRIVRGTAGMAGELGHIQIPMHGLLAEGQPLPHCNCGLFGDVESVASLTGILKNLLPYWLKRYPNHDLGHMPIEEAAKKVRDYGEKQDELALEVFEQQAIAIGRLFSLAANFTDPDAYFVGGGVVEAKLEFRNWFLAKVRENTTLRAEQLPGRFELVHDLDMAGARGAAEAALEWIRTHPADSARVKK